MAFAERNCYIMKKKFTTRILSVLIVALMICTMLPVTALAATQYGNATITDTYGNFYRNGVLTTGWKVSVSNKNGQSFNLWMPDPTVAGTTYSGHVRYTANQNGTGTVSEHLALTYYVNNYNYGYEVYVLPSAGELAEAGIVPNDGHVFDHYEITYYNRTTSTGSFTEIKNAVFRPNDVMPFGADLAYKYEKNQGYLDITAVFVEDPNRPVTTDYVLTYDTNGGKEANWTDTQTTTADYADFTVSSTVPTRDGYTFLGWADAATATQSSYQADDTLRLTKSTPTKTIYAVWQKNVEKYTVEFQYPAGTTVETLEVEQGQTVTTLGEEKFYDGAYDETYNWKLTGWQDQNGATYGLLEDITVNGNLVLTPVVDQALLLCDGPTGNVMGVLFESDYTAGRNDLLAGTLSYTSPMTAAVAPGGDKGFAVNGTRKTVFGMEQDVDYTFAGWFFAPGQGTDNAHLNWTADNNVGTADLFHCDQVQDNRIYAYWIYADYSAAQIGYQSNSLRATNVYINATVPDDIFHHYGFVVSTAATENDEDNLVIGGVIGGKKVGNYQKETVYETFCAAPIYEEEYTAQDFNSGLPGYDANRTGYITYFYWRNMQLKNASGDFTTLSARAYYQTLEGTVVYGDMSQVTFEPNNIYNPMFGGSDF